MSAFKVILRVLYCKGCIYLCTDTGMQELAAPTLIGLTDDGLVRYCSAPNTVGTAQSQKYDSHAFRLWSTKDVYTVQVQYGTTHELLIYDFRT